MFATSCFSVLILDNELLEKKTKEITNNRRRLENGLSILRGAEEKVIFFFLGFDSDSYCLSSFAIIVFVFSHLLISLFLCYALEFR